MKKKYDEKLFKAFQANLLSLISHELRTPLTGVINSIQLLREGGHTEELMQEFIAMAFRNVNKLNQSLSAILDVASIESGSFVVRLKEVKLKRILKRRIDIHKALLGELKIQIICDEQLLKEQNTDSVILADPSKFSRVIDLCFQVISDWISNEKKLEIMVDQQRVSFIFSFDSLQKEDFINTWKILENPNAIQDSFSLIAFSSTMQSQEGFLSRTREGLGSELMLIYYIMTLHKGDFTYSLNEDSLQLKLTFPQMTSLSAIREVVSSRVYDSTHGLKSLALGLVQVPEKIKLEVYQDKIKKALFRSTDAAYPITESHSIALVLDDCKKEDVPFLLKRISDAVGSKCKITFVCCPEEGTDPDYLLELVQKKAK